MVLETTTDSAAMRSTAAMERTASLDVLRGIALAGMFLVHFNDQSSAASSTVAAGYQRAVTLLFEERFWAMFGILFGAGFAVQLRRADARGRSFAPMYLRRLLALAAVGLFTHAVLGYHVLFEYAVWGAALLLFRRWPVRALVVAAVISAASGSLYAIAHASYGIATAGEASYREELASKASYNQAFRRANLDAQAATDYRIVFAARLQHIAWFYTQPYSFLPVNTLTLFLIGMIAIRLGLFDRPAEHRGTIAVAASAGLASWALATWVLPAPPDLPGGPLLPGLAMAEAARGFGVIREMWLAFAYIGVVLLLVARDRAWLDRLSAFAVTGRMALTNYVLQLIILEALFARYALGSRIAPLGAAAAAIALFLVDAAISRWWLDRFHYGPLEWAWRSVTYGQFQPFGRRR